MNKTKSDTVGQLMFKLEDVVMELACEHELQWGDILGLVYTYMMVHLPDAREEYIDGGHPEFYYGPKRDSKITDTGEGL